MRSFPLYMRSVFTSAFLLMMLSALGWFLLPPCRIYFAGYVLGLIFSMLNGLITLVKTVKTGDYAQGLTKRHPGTGMLQRFALAGFAGYVAFKFPDTFDWATLLIGMVTVTLLSLIIALILHVREKYSAERGER